MVEVVFGRRRGRERRRRRRRRRCRRPPPSSRRGRRRRWRRQRRLRRRRRGCRRCRGRRCRGGRRSRRRQRCGRRRHRRRCIIIIGAHQRLDGGTLLVPVIRALFANRALGSAARPDSFCLPQPARISYPDHQENPKSRTLNSGPYCSYGIVSNHQGIKENLQFSHWFQ